MNRTPYHSILSAASDVIATGPVRLLSFTCHNINASRLYLQFHDQAEELADNDVSNRVFVFAIEPNSRLTLDERFFGPGGELFSAALQFGESSAVAPFTAVVTPKFILDLYYDQL
jgi:hypothetical protein